MRFTAILSAVVVAAATCVAAWSKEDTEIFKLNHDIQSSEGSNVTFYSFLGVKNPKASVEDINKAYRKVSMPFHPDKFRPKQPVSEPGKPPRKLTKFAIRQQKAAAHEKYTRMGLVVKILRGPLRERYDHFLLNGFPKWKGTGYYYARFRPGLGSVLAGLFVVVGGAAHYLYLVLDTSQKKKFLGKYLKDARVSAWGPAGVPGIAEAAAASGASEPAQERGPVNRRERRGMLKQRGTKSGDDEKEEVPAPPPVVVGSAGHGRRKVVAGNGKVLIVDSLGNVFLVEQDEETGEDVELPLDLNDIPNPRIADTAMVRLPKWIFAKTVGRFLPQKKEPEYDEIVDEEEDDSVDTDANTSGAEPEKKKKKPTGPGVAHKLEKRDSLPRRKVVRK
ncbi:hypothetical protein DFH27DRAFT_538467 [Peziza echinospora]|nr:hypothetical protein DFH27DRAFT_538467 [Peziza echinospora]